jgi:hypothetical protein
MDIFVVFAYFVDLLIGAKCNPFKPSSTDEDGFTAQYDMRYLLVAAAWADQGPRELLRWYAKAQYSQSSYGVPAWVDRNVHKLASKFAWHKVGSNRAFAGDQGGVILQASILLAETLLYRAEGEWEKAAKLQLSTYVDQWKIERRVKGLLFVDLRIADIYEEYTAWSFPAPEAEEAPIAE